MHIEEYIASGILEAYVTGSLTPSEMREVEAMAAAHDEVRRELHAIGLAMEKYADAHAKKPSDKVLGNILQAIGEQPKNTEVAEPEPVTKVATMRAMRFRALAIAATMLLFLSVIANLYYYNRVQKVSDELALLQSQNLELAQSQKAIQTNYDLLASEMAVLQDPASVSITLKGLPNHPDASAVICWNKSSGKVYMVNTNLPQPEPGKQYQLWALIDGKPVDAGVFNTTVGLQTMKSFGTANAFAVTLEPAGGSAVPTLDQMYVMAGV